MALEFPNILIAACLVDANGGAFLRSKGFVGLVANGPGDFTLTLKEEMNGDAAIILATLQETPPGSVNGCITTIRPAQPDNLHIRVVTSTVPQGANKNMKFALAVFQLSADAQ